MYSFKEIFILRFVEIKSFNEKNIALISMKLGSAYVSENSKETKKVSLKINFEKEIFDNIFWTHFFRFLRIFC